MMQLIRTTACGVALSLCGTAVGSADVATSQRTAATLGALPARAADSSLLGAPSVQPITVRFQLDETDGAPPDEHHGSTRRRLLWLGLGALVLGAAAAAAGGGGGSDDDGPIATDFDPDFDPTVADIEVIRPESSSPVTTATDARNDGSKARDVARARVDLDVPQRGLFLSVGAEDIDRRQSTLTRASTTSTAQFTVGYDQLLNAKTLVGVLAVVSSSDVTVASAAETTESTSRSVLLFSNHQHSESLALSGYIGLSSLNIDSVRFPEGLQPGFTDLVDRSVAGSTSGVERKLGASVSKDFALPGGARIEAHLDGDFTATEIDAYTERGTSGEELAFPERTERTTAFRVGVQASKVVSARSGVFIPQLGVDLVNESTDRDTFRAALVSNPALETEVEPEPTDDSYSLAHVGFVFVNARRVQFFGKLQQAFGHRFDERSGLSAGLRIAF